MSKAVILLLLLQVLAIWGDGKFMIKNKKTGYVLDGQNQIVTMGAYEGKNSQLWTRKQKDGAFTIINVGNGKALDACPKTRIILTWPVHGGKNQQWEIEEDGRIRVRFYPNEVLVHQNNKLSLDNSRHSDESDEWLLVEP